VELIKDKKFYWMLASLALPMALQDLIKFSLSLADNIMVGSLSQTDLSAAALANQPFFIFALFCFGLACGGTVLVAQYYGKGDTVAIRRVVAITFNFGLICSVLVAAAVLIFPEQIMRIYTTDAQIIAKGSEYLRIVGWSYILFGVTNTFFLLLRSVRNVRIALMISGSSFFLNVFLNWIFIFGNFGAPAMGISGAALGTLLSRIYEFVFLAVYLLVFEKTLKITLRSLFKLDRLLVKDFFRYSIPVVINEVVWSLGISMQSVILGHMGGDAIAASSIVTTAQQVISVILYGLGGAAFVIIGNQLGAGGREKITKTSNTLLFLSVLVGLLIGGVLFASKGFIIGLYNVPESTVGLAGTFIDYISVISVFTAFDLTSIVGVLRGGGDTRYAMMLDILLLWIFSVPLGAFLAFLGVPVMFVFFALKSDEVVRSFFCMARIRSKKWINDVTREQPVS